MPAFAGACSKNWPIGSVFSIQRPSAVSIIMCHFSSPCSRQSKSAVSSGLPATSLEKTSRAAIGVWRLAG